MSRLSSYLYTFNVDHYPLEACVKSCLGFSDEVVVVDFGSYDSTQEILNCLADPKVHILEERWDYEEPGMDGKAKAIARAACQHDWVFQIDADEVVPERYWRRIRDAIITMEKRGLRVADIGTVNFFLSLNRVCYHPDAGLFKARLSRKVPFTHGIPKQYRRFNSQGRVYCTSPSSDGTDLLLPDGAQVTADISFADADYNRAATSLDHSAVCERLLKALECGIYVYHYGSVSLLRKLWKASEYWMSTWELLYGKPPIILRTDEERRRLVEDHYRSRLEKALPYTFEVDDIVHSQEVYSFYGFSS